MARLYRFNENEKNMIDQTVSQAEILTRNYYQIGSKDWKNIRFEIKSMEDLNENERVDNAFAQLGKYRGVSGKASQGYRFSSFRVCLQDDNILKAVKERREQLRLKPLLLYVLTHELIHVVRFNRYPGSFESCLKEREIEEKTVHSSTYQILKDSDMSGMGSVLEHYRHHRTIEKN